MKYLPCALLLVFCFYAFSEARSPQACGYTALDGHFVFLRYFPDPKEGEDFIDYGNNKDGVCSQRAVCLESYDTKVQSCNDYKLDCNNVQSSQSTFPACCVKC